MQAIGNLILVFQLLSTFVKVFESRPVVNGTREGQNNCFLPVQYAGRVRRSIPEFDAVNPVSLDQDILPDQDDPVDHQQQDLSQFSLGDHVGNLFRSHKSVKVPQKPAERDLSMDVGREENNALRSDEQDECYRQQNIEPPLMEEDPRSHRKWVKQQGPRVMPIMDVAQPRRAIPSVDIAQGPKLSFVPFVRSEILKESGKRSEQKDNTQEVNSLYSNPVQQYNLKVVKQYPKKKPTSEYFILKDKKVPIPINVHANFPIYDDDIDFDPDPLQGILDERYWFDPRENEPVMKMNIDEPIDERAPFNYYAHHQKRSASDKSGKKKLFKECYKSSKEAENSRNEVESCNECSKGKNAKKTNNTEGSDEGISYGRKLLSLVDMRNYFDAHLKLANTNDDNEDDDGDEQRILKRDDLYRSRKLLSFEDEDTPDSDNLERDENVSASKYLKRKLLCNDGGWVDTVPETNDNAVKTNFKSSRNLLWYDEYEDIDESYNGEYDDLHESSGKNYDDDIRLDIHSSEYNGHYDYDQKVYESSSTRTDFNNLQMQELKHSIKIKGHSNDIDSKVNVLDEKMEEVNYDHDAKIGLYAHRKNLDNRNPKQFNVYKNVLEKGDFSKKTLNNLDAKEVSVAHKKIIHKQKIDSSNMSVNIGQNMISESNFIKNGDHGNLPKIYVSNKIGDILQKPQQEKPKGPRKNEQIDPNEEFRRMRNETFKNASMGFTTVSSNMRVGDKSLYKRGNSILTPKNRRSFTDESAIKANSRLEEAHLIQGPQISGGEGKKQESTSAKAPLSDSLSTNKNASVHYNHTTESSIITSHNTTQTKNDDEESVDSKIANEIVESVFAESEKSSYHHNLGVCRRNESLMNIKFGKIIPETEKVIRFVTNCIMDKIKDHLAKQSCILLDEELIEFLKWLVLSGESYKEYEQKMGPKFFDFVPPSTEEPTTCGSPTVPICEQPGESLPPNPAIAQQALSIQQSAKDSIHPPKLSFNE